jgi:hypothetical protein
MKKSHFLFFALGVLMLPACNHGTEEYVTYMTNEPVFMSVSEFRSSVDVEEPKPIEEQGKIAFYSDYLYISQPGKGIHVIDNRMPSNPRNIAFIELLGNADMHIKGNMLYADSFIDLVWFDISDPAAPVLKGRKEEVFPEALPPIENHYGCDYAQAMDRKNGIVVGWKVVEKKELVSNYNSRWHWGWGWSKELMYTDAASSTGNSTGMVGSMSRFAIYKDYLYTILHNQLGIFDLTGETPEKVGKEVYVGDNAETIFPYKDYLFFGTPTGMIVYSVENPTEPVYMSRVIHILGCDPVVVEDDIAYVTVRSGDFCGQDVDMLMVIDVKDVKHPKPIVEYAMYNPKGLGIDNGTLFVCDKGLRVFNAKDPLALMTEANKLAHFQEMDGLDVIPYNNVLMMIADDGIYQYDYTDVTKIKLLSVLPIGK